MTTVPITQNLDQKLVEVISQLQAGMGEVGNALYKATPQVVDAMLAVKQIEGAGNLMIGAISLFFGVLLCVICVKLFKKGQIVDAANYDPCCWYAGAVVTAVCSIVLFLNTCGCLGDIWNWVAVFNPKIAVAHDIIIKITGK